MPITHDASLDPMKLKGTALALSDYPPQVIEAVRIYSLTGNLALAARETGIAYHNLYRVVNADRVKQDLGQIKDLMRRNLAHKFAMAAELGTNRAIDALVNGDEVVDSATGERYHKQVSGRDAAYITSVMSQQYRHETSLIEQSDFNARLALLAERLIDIASANQTQSNNNTGGSMGAESGRERGEGANLNVEKVVAAQSSHSNDFPKPFDFIS